MVVPLGGRPAPLDPDLLTGTLGGWPEFPVTEGQVLELEFGALVPNAPITVADGESDLGGELINGVPVPGRSLVYKLLYR